MAKSISQITLDFSAINEPGEAEIVIASAETSNAVSMQKESISTTAIAKEKKSVQGRRSIMETAMRADLIQVPPDELLFQKQYYSIGEVAVMFGEKQSLIRYWETSFDILKPQKNKKGDRFFRPVDIKNLVLIHDLLRRRKFTLQGAMDYLQKNKRAEEKFGIIQSLQTIRQFLLELKSAL